MQRMMLISCPVAVAVAISVAVTRRRTRAQSQADRVQYLLLRLAGLASQLKDVQEIPKKAGQDVVSPSVAGMWAGQWTGRWTQNGVKLDLAGALTP
jgi:hypothetical protein